MRSFSIRYLFFLALLLPPLDAFSNEYTFDNIADNYSKINLYESVGTIEFYECDSRKPDIIRQLDSTVDFSVVFKRDHSMVLSWSHRMQGNLFSMSSLHFDKDHIFFTSNNNTEKTFDSIESALSVNKGTSGGLTIILPKLLAGYEVFGSSIEQETLYSKIEQTIYHLLVIKDNTTQYKIWTGIDDDLIYRIEIKKLSSLYFKPNHLQSSCFIARQNFQITKIENERNQP